VKAHKTLTDHEAEAADFTIFDLASGYPRVPIPDYVRDLYMSQAISGKSLEFSPIWTPSDQRDSDEQLESSLAVMLDLRHGTYRFLGVTFSGSIALDRALTAAIAMATERAVTTEPSRIHVITTSPSIDIIKLLLLERRLLSIHMIESRLRQLGGLDTGGVLAKLEEIGRQAPSARPVVVLTSPENPTGEVWTARALTTIAEACGRRGGVLIVDHSFLKAGVHDPADVPAVWNVLPPDADWIALWDTGKTFGLNEDKLGFLICSDRAAQHVRESLNVIQFDVSRRMKLFFAELLREAARHDYVRHLRDICRLNLDTAQRLCRGGAKIRPTAAGSLTTLMLDSSRFSDQKVQQHLLGKGIGVVIGRVFFHTAWCPPNLLRVALAREPDYFAEGFRLAVEEIEAMDQ
jgi:hypothetical protein